MRRRASLAAAIAACAGFAAAQAELPRPRERQDADATAALALRQLGRFDRNRDGRVAAGEWNGAPGAFQRLDLDRNGVLDKKDEKLADARLEAKRAGTYDELQFEAPLPDAEALLARYDRDGDQRLSRIEAKGAAPARLLALADLDRDSMLDQDELQAMAREVAARVRRGAARHERERAFEVPFSTWDKDKDHRLEVAEWLERQHLFARIDVDRDGAVTEEEVTRYESTVEGDDFVEKFDLDRDGRVTPAEFAGPRDAFRRADRNGDGAISRADR